MQLRASGRSRAGTAPPPSPPLLLAPAAALARPLPRSWPAAVVALLGDAGATAAAAGAVGAAAAARQFEVWGSHTCARRGAALQMYSSSPLSARAWTKARCRAGSWASTGPGSEKRREKKPVTCGGTRQGLGHCRGAVGTCRPSAASTRHRALLPGPMHASQVAATCRSTNCVARGEEEEGAAGPSQAHTGRACKRPLRLQVGAHSCRGADAARRSWLQPAGRQALTQPKREALQEAHCGAGP